MMSPRALLPLLLAVLLAGCPPPGLTVAEAVLIVEPPTLDLGGAAVGAEVAGVVRVRNEGRAAGTATVSVEGPGFSVAAQEVTVAGGAEEPVTVRFRPVAEGAASGRLLVGGAGEVQLTAQGLAACVPSGPCRAATFDPATRRCVEAVVPDGEVCSSACLRGGACQAGACVGTDTTCDDGDACTIDACTTDGRCVAVPRECASDNPCRAAACDPATGCGAVDVADGTPCGDATCAEVRLCLGGACVARATPNAQQACHYRQLAAGTGFACALTLAGRVRCWGVSQYASVPPRPGDHTTVGLDYAFASVPPTEVPNLGPNVETLGAWSGGSLAVLADGTFWASKAAAPPVDLSPGVTRLGCDDSSRTCALLLRGGRAVRWDRFTGALLTANVDGVRDVGGAGTLVFEDGGSLAGVPGPALEVVDARGTPWLRLDDGRVVTPSYGGLTLFDGGAVAFGVQRTSVSDEVCAAFPGGVVECRLATGAVTTRETLPEEVVAMSRACALTAGGNVYCPGGDGALVSLRPVGLADAGASLPELSPTRTVLAVEGALRLFGDGAGVASLDGGASGPVLGFIDGVHHLALGSSRGWALLDGGAVLQWGAGEPVHRLPLERVVAVVADSRALLALDDTGAVRREDGRVLYEGVRQLTRARLVLRDGGVIPALPTMEPVVEVSEGCARFSGGRVGCWLNDGGLETPAGLWPLARGVTGTAQSGCILFGAGGVQCWGDNYFGQLGRQGPASARAVTLPVGGNLDAIVTSGRHVCVRESLGAVRCWGDASTGQLGLVPPSGRLERIVR